MANFDFTQVELGSDFPGLKHVYDKPKICKVCRNNYLADRDRSFWCSPECLFAEQTFNKLNNYFRLQQVYNGMMAEGVPMLSGIVERLLKQTHQTVGENNPNYKHGKYIGHSRYIPKQRPPKICQFEGCLRVARKADHGLCGAHLAQQKRGQPLRQLTFNSKHGEFGYYECKISECHNPRQAFGFCGRHWNRCKQFMAGDIKKDLTLEEQEDFDKHVQTHPIK